MFQFTVSNIDHMWCSMYIFKKFTSVREYSYIECSIWLMHFYLLSLVRSVKVGSIFQVIFDFMNMYCWLQPVSALYVEISEETRYLSASAVCGFGNVGKCTHTLSQGFELLKINKPCMLTYLTVAKWAQLFFPPWINIKQIKRVVENVLLTPCLRYVLWTKH